ncbi:MAG: glycosyltransferase family 2 protein [Ferruginibacter sp.]
MDLSIIIVNYKTAQLVLDCIHSIYQFDYSGSEIIVVDNASADSLEEKLAALYPGVRFIQMGYNSGFARANNKGIQSSTGEVILLLNSDTIILNNAIQNCYVQLVASKYVACGVQLLNPDHSPQISGNFAMMGGMNYLLPLPYTGQIIKYLGELFKIRKPNVPDVSGVAEVDWINGAFLMVRKSAIEKAGLLDEDFFLYAEEAEWCSRIKNTGPLCIFGSEKIIHFQGSTANDIFGSSGQGYFNLSDKKGLQIMLSNFVRIRKEFGVLWFLVIAFFYLFTIPFFLIVLIFSKLFSKSPSYNFDQWKGFMNNVFSTFTFIPRIINNKPYFYKVL